MIVLGGRQVRSLLADREADVVEAVRAAYLAHAAGETSVPHSLFLRFPHDARSRIIALPAYLGGAAPAAGVKWVSSFPANLEVGLERASAVVILNDPDTGRPQAMLEASAINARRTAASAALAAAELHRSPAARVGLIGCGPVNFEIARFLHATRPELEGLDVLDLDPGRAEQFRAACARALPRLQVRMAERTQQVLEQHSLVAFATTAGVPHVEDLSMCPPGAVILHISLRDLAPQAILASDNVTDDADHVCREQTSLHLAEQLTGGRSFIRCSLGEILSERCPARRDTGGVTVFSPFGLGVLDLAVADLVRRRAIERGIGTTIDDFLPPSWLD